jgi:glutamate:Na+ symporter, ESS family
MITISISIVLLGFAYLIKEKVSFFKKSFVPVSLVVGFVGLCFFTLGAEYKTSLVFLDWKNYPTECMAVIFAGLFLKKTEETKKSETLEVLSQTIFVWISILGQTLLGVLLTLLLFRPLFGMPIYFGTVMEAGFAGGHGTAINLGFFFEKYGFTEGKEYALFSATLGIFFGIFGGVLLLKREHKGTEQNLEEKSETYQFSFSELLISAGVLFAAYTIGHLFFYLDESLGEGLPIQIPSLPLFFYTLLGGLFIRFILNKTNILPILNENVISLITGFFMDLLIVSAVSTIEIQLLTGAIFPLMILLTLGFLWNIFTYLFLKEKLFLPEYSKELGILNFGMLNGTTAIGMALLKIINPKLDSKAVRVYAESIPFTAPFIGGGIITLQLPYLLTNYSPIKIAIILFFSILIFYAIGRYIFQKNRLPSRI